VMEFLLINHPLDCPICDQGGECDLQDQAMAYGVDFSRYREPKRAAIDPDLGPLVGTCMTRCISCTRCVRFLTEVAGVPEMGQTGRGEDSEVTSYLGAMLTSELQGNVIDLCPVGALTSKPYAYSARPWELRKTESIDVIDALGTNIRVDVRGREVMRILPRNHDEVNEEWMADRSRFVWDGLRRQRLDRPYVRRDGKLHPATWGEAFGVIAEATRGKRVAALAGDLAPAEAVYALRELVRALGGTTECRVDGARLPAGNRSAFVGTATILDVEAADAILLVGTNPRNEAPVLNARMRKAWLNGAEIAVVGEAVDLTYPHTRVGAGPGDIATARDGLAQAERPVIVVGMGALRRPDGEAVLARVMALAGETGAKLLVLHTAAARVGAMDLGFTTEGGLEAALDGAEVIYALGVDEIELPEGAFVVYQGSHGDRGAHRADVILPACAYTEETGIFVNMEGRPQMANRAGFPPGDARENWAIIRALSAALDATLPFDSVAELRAAMVSQVPHLGRIDQVPENAWTPVAAGDITDHAFVSVSADHYLGTPIGRASEVMAEMSRLARSRSAPPLAAE
jgi:NADH-quinone oxidoreductase subunit G